MSMFLFILDYCWLVQSQASKMVTALLVVILPTMPTVVSLMGIVSEILVAIQYYGAGEIKNFGITVGLMILPIVTLFLATILNIEKARDEDPDIIKNNILLRAIYYAFHIKMFRIYFRTVAGAVREMCNPERENPCKNVYEATMIRRYLAFTGVAFQLVNQMNILFNRYNVREYLEPEDSIVMFAVGALTLSLGCSLALHHCSDKLVDYDAHWSIPVRFMCTLVIYMWKLALVLARAFAAALFLYEFGVFLVVPVVLHGIFVAIIFIACTKPAIDGFGGYMKFLIICYCQMFDINDVYINEISGETLAIAVYYIFRLAGDAGLIIPFFLLTNVEHIKTLALIIVFAATGGGILLRILYYRFLHPKWR